MTADTVPERLCVRLCDRDRAALATIAAAIATPHRSPVTVTEALRAALSAAATSMAGFRAVHP